MTRATRTVPQAIAAAIDAHSERIAILGEDGAALTYRELDAQRRLAARALLALGIGQGERVAIWAPNCAEWIVVALAVQSIGAVLVPVNTRLRGQEVGYMLQRSGARLLFSTGQFLGRHYPSLIGGHRPACLEHVIVLHEEQPGDISLAEFLQAGSSVAAAEVDARIAAIQPNDRLDILFTSGTTGQPKGVITAHEQNLRVIAEWSAHMGLVPEDRYLVVAPFFHSFGYKVGWLAGLIAGLTVLPHAVFDAGAILARIARERVSVLPGPPTLLMSLINDPARPSADLTSLRATITGAAPIAPAWIEQIRAELGFRIVLTGYGQTETCGIISLCRPDDDARTIALTSGRAIAGTEVRCVSADGRTLPPGEAGEILVRGYNLFEGYLDDEFATREVMDADGWLHTGDIGVLDEQGYVKITDRLKDMYITGGFNCYPAEIERLMAAHPAIAQVAVIGVPDERLGEVGRAFVVLRRGLQFDESSLVAWCRGQMANYKVPRAIEFTAELPTNSSGKVLKYELRAAVRRSTGAR